MEVIILAMNLKLYTCNTFLLCVSRVKFYLQLSTAFIPYVHRRFLTTFSLQTREIFWNLTETYWVSKGRKKIREDPCTLDLWYIPLRRRHLRCRWVVSLCIRSWRGCVRNHCDETQRDSPWVWDTKSSSLGPVYTPWDALPFRATGAAVRSDPLLGVGVWMGAEVPLR